MKQKRKINSKEDFLDFLAKLQTDLESHKNEWENDNLARYLEGIYGFCHDIEGYYKNSPKEMPEDINWDVFAQILSAAKYYE